MKVEFIAIGDEILSGRTQDTNGKWLATFLGQHDLTLDAISIVGDSADAICEQLQQSWQRSDLVIVSGGLGPTKDDITKNTLATFFNKELAESSQAQEIATKNYANYNRPFIQDNTGYHILPKDFVALENPCGAAPGLLYQQKHQLLISAPGVPREFQQMIQEIGLKQIQKRLDWRPHQSNQVNIRTYGIPEEDIFFKLSLTMWDELQKFGKVSSLPQNFAVDIVITLKEGKSEQELIDWVRSSALAPYIWQIGNVPLPEYIILKAKEKGITIALAESCTGGMVSSTLTDVPGSSAVFMGSVISYSNDAKIEIIDVPVSLIVKHGSVSTQVAQAMAIGARKYLRSSIAISLTGIAGPDGGTDQKPVGTVAMGFATKEQSGSELNHFAGDRLRLKERFTRTALFKLLELIGP